MADQHRLSLSGHQVRPRTNFECLSEPSIPLYDYGEPSITLLPMYDGATCVPLIKSTTT